MGQIRLRIVLLCVRSGHYLCACEEDRLNRLCDLHKMENEINFVSYHSYYPRPLFKKIKKEISFCLPRTVKTKEKETW